MRVGLVIAAALLVVAGCRSYDTDPDEPPDQEQIPSDEAAEEPGTGGSGSESSPSNVNDAANTDPSMNRGEDLEDERFDPSAVVR